MDSRSGRSRATNHAAKPVDTADMVHIAKNGPHPSSWKRTNRKNSGNGSETASRPTILARTELANLLLSEGDGLAFGTYEAGAAPDISYYIPGIVRHYHLDEHIAGEDLSFRFFFRAVVLYLHNRFGGDGNLLDKIVEIPVFNNGFNIACNLVFIA